MKPKNIKIISLAVTGGIIASSAVLPSFADGNVESPYIETITEETVTSELLGSAGEKTEQPCAALCSLADEQTAVTGTAVSEGEEITVSEEAVVTEEQIPDVPSQEFPDAADQGTEPSEDASSGSFDESPGGQNPGSAPSDNTGNTEAPASSATPSPSAVPAPDNAASPVEENPQTPQTPKAPSIFVARSQAQIEALSSFTYFCQGDYPDIAYSGGTIANAGCFPTAFAMTASSLLGRNITPSEVASVISSGQTLNPTTGDHAGVRQVCSVYGLNLIGEFGGSAYSCHGGSCSGFDMAYLIDMISKGHPAIISATNGLYSSSNGHYYVLCGAGVNGGYIYDPQSRGSTYESLANDGIPWEDLFSGSKHIWLFEDTFGAKEEAKELTGTEKAVKTLTDNGIKKEDAEALLKKETVTELDVLKMLYTAEKTPDVSSLTSVFTNIKTDKEAAKNSNDAAILWAEKEGFVKDNRKHLYNPSKILTKEDLFNLIYSYAQYKGKDTKVDDVKLDAYTDKDKVKDSKAVKYAEKTGILKEIKSKDEKVVVKEEGKADFPDIYIPIPGTDKYLTEKDGSITGCYEKKNGRFVKVETPSNITLDDSIIEVKEEKGTYYVRYTRAENDTYRFIECDKNKETITKDADENRIGAGKAVTGEEMILSLGTLFLAK